MQPITRRAALTTGAALASAATLAACSGSDDESDAQDQIDEPDENINVEGMPIVEEPVTLTMMTRRSPGTAEDWNEVANVKEMEELTNVHVDWGPVPWEGADEKRNLALASGDYPEILHRTDLGAVDIAKYGEQGTFLPLNDLIEQYMPNLKALLDADPDATKGLTFPDGNIYSIPTLYDPDFDALLMQQRLWVRTDWLDDFGMEPPETIEDFEAFCQEVKNTNPAPSDGPDAIPYTGGIEGLFIEMFWGTFDVANKGGQATYIDSDESGALRFWPTSENYLELLEFLHRMYADELIQQDIFATDTQQFNSLGTQGLLGAAATQSPSAYFGNEVGENYMSLPPLKKNSSDPVPSWNSIWSTLQSIGQFVLTDKCEHPIETARWMDYHFSDEGQRLFFMGIEGETYEETSDGEYEFLPEIAENPDGLTLDEALKPYVTYLGGGYAGIVTQDYFKAFNEQSLTGVEAVVPHRLEEVWPVFTYTSEEAAELTALTTDLTKLVSESQSKFITGEMSSSDWGTYVDQCEQMGLPQFLEIQQAAYERYSG